MASLFIRGKRYWIRYFDFDKGMWRNRPTQYDHPQDKGKAVVYKMEVTLEETKRRGGKLQISQRGMWLNWTDAYIDFRYEHSPKSHSRVKAAWKLLFRFLEEQKLSHPRQWRYEHNEEYVRWKKQLKKTGGKSYADNSAIYDLKQLSMLMNEARRRKYIETSNVSTKKLPRSKVKEKPALTDDEIKLIRVKLAERQKQQATLLIGRKHKRIDWPNLANIFEICLATGCRLFESSIRFGDIDFTRKTLTFAAPKGGEERAFTVPILSDKFAAWLKKLVQRRKAAKHQTTTDIRSFTSRDFGAFCDEIGLPDITYHCLRVTFITRGYLAGVHETVMRKLVNHASDLVHRIYQRFTIDNVRDMASTLKLPPP